MNSYRQVIQVADNGTMTFSKCYIVVFLIPDAFIKSYFLNSEASFSLFLETTPEMMVLSSFHCRLNPYGWPYDGSDPIWFI